MEKIKILGQSNPAATTLTTVYTVPDSKAAVVSSLVVCNQGAAGSFRIAVIAASFTAGAKYYNYYDVALAANDTFTATIGISLSNVDFIQVYASHANMGFSLYGVEKDQTNVYAP